MTPDRFPVRLVFLLASTDFTQVLVAAFVHPSPFGS